MWATLNKKLSGVRLQGMWQVAVGASLAIMFVAIPMTLDAFERLAHSKKLKGEGSSVLQEQVFQKRLALRKLVDTPSK